MQNLSPPERGLHSGRERGETQARELETWESGFISVLIIGCGRLRSCPAVPDLDWLRIQTCPCLAPALGSRSQGQGERGADSELRIEEEEKTSREVHSDRRPGIRKDRDPVTTGLQGNPAGEDSVKRVVAMLERFGLDFPKSHRMQSSGGVTGRRLHPKVGDGPLGANRGAAIRLF